MNVYTLAVLLAILAVSQGLQRDDSITSYFCTKSAYRFSSNTDVTDVTADDSDSVEKVWMFLRHGTRNPSKGDINDFKDDLPDYQKDIIKANKKNGVLTDDELELFNSWSPIVTDVADQQILTPEGEQENIELAQRMQLRYPNLFPPVFDNDTYLFKYTDSQRTEASAKHFAIGLFGAENAKDVYFPELTYDDLVVLEFYDLCIKWIKEVEDNSDSLKEREAFEKTDAYKKAVKKVIDAVRLDEGDISKKGVKKMYKACAFETSWFRNISSPWCIPFDVDTIRPFAYAEDLEYYWVDGYGNSLNYKQACPTFGDMINFFEEESNRKAALYFTHSGAVIKFIAHLGLFKDDEHLLSSNFNTNHDRQWKTSKLGNFATNVAVFLHNIDGTKKISIRQNEHIMRLPACPDSDLCDLEIVKQYYQESLNDCNFNEICGLD